MKEKALLKKKTGIGKLKDNLLSSAEYFINNGDTQMKASRLRKQSRRSENLKIYFNKKPRGEN